MKITEFKKGDIITRIESSIAIFGGGLNFLGMNTSLSSDRSYMGEELKFLGIANNQIYFQSLDSLTNMIFGKDKIFNLPIDAFEEGWDYFVDPRSFLEDNQPIESLSREQLQSQLQKALSEENYEKASDIEKQLKNIKN
jgi:hypothetical protein